MFQEISVEKDYSSCLSADNTEDISRALVNILVIVNSGIFILNDYKSGKNTTVKYM